MVEKARNMHYVPLDCPVCKFAMRHQGDLDMYDTYECCEDCGLRLAQPNRDRWKAGWRPTNDVIEQHRAWILSQPSYLCNVF